MAPSQRGEIAARDGKIVAITVVEPARARRGAGAA
jgi:hypothetical protein